MKIKATVIIHIYNEEYLLPFWLNHHKNIFDHGIIIDYRSTDSSLDICKEICPTWDIITTRNESFDAENVDLEVMDIEDKISGIKICLNVTEFLFSLKPIQEYFKDGSLLSYSIKLISPYSSNLYYPDNNHELIQNLFNADITFHNDRYTRQLHNFKNGNYTTGRHTTKNPAITNDKELHIIWFGYHPLNELLLKRKLQIKNNIPYTDIMKGYSSQHMYNMEDMLAVNADKVSCGMRLKDINPSLYEILTSYLTII
jgi:hypothetical protein